MKSERRAFVTLRPRRGRRGGEQPEFRPLRFAQGDISLVSGILLLTLLTACTLPPLRGKAQVGYDPYAIVAADGNGGTDLYAIIGAGNDVVRVTFTPVGEEAPVLSPDGGMVAFLRTPRPGGSGVPQVWVLNLLRGMERELKFPAGPAPAVRRLGWSPDSRRIYAETGAGLWQWPIPPGDSVASVVPVEGRAAADSGLRVLLGDPPFASVVACDSAGPALCVLTRDSVRQVLARNASAAARWGSDSVAWIVEGKIAVRPLGGGETRIIELKENALNPEALTYFPGTRR